MLTMDQIGGSMAAVGLNALFGVIYALFINYANKRGWLEGYTAIAVVIGTLVTLTINQIFVYVSDDSALDLLLELAGFGASGAPMVANNIYEYLLRKRQEMLLELSEVGNGVGDE